MKTQPNNLGLYNFRDELFIINLASMVTEIPYKVEIIFPPAANPIAQTVKTSGCP